ncbi:MAG: hypothetical protein ACP5OP_02775 [Leptospirillia bacterium]
MSESPKDKQGANDNKLRLPKSFIILGGGSILVMAAGVVYTIFFYLSLPNHRDLDKAGQSVRHVPLPVPPNSFFPTGKGPKVDSFVSKDFSLRVAALKKTLTGFDVTLELTARSNGSEGEGISLAVAGTPRWVDSGRNSGEGESDLSTGTLFKAGAPGEFTIHFSRMPQAPVFDLYLGLVGTRGIKGDRFLTHFRNIPTPRATS